MGVKLDPSATEPLTLHPSPQRNISVEILASLRTSCLWLCRAACSFACDTHTHKTRTQVSWSERGQTIKQSRIGWCGGGGWGGGLSWLTERSKEQQCTATFPTRIASFASHEKGIRFFPRKQAAKLRQPLRWHAFSYSSNTKSFQVLGLKPYLLPTPLLPLPCQDCRTVNLSMVVYGGIRMPELLNQAAKATHPRWPLDSKSCKHGKRNYREYRNLKQPGIPKRQTAPMPQRRD